MFREDESGADRPTEEEVSVLRACRVLEVDGSEANGRRRELEGEAEGPLARKARVALLPEAAPACEARLSVLYDQGWP